MSSLCIVETQVIVNNIQIFSVTQKWLYSAFMSSTDNRTELSPRVKCPVFFLSYSNQIWSWRQIFIEVYNVKFYGNPSSGSRADTRGRMGKRTETWTDIKLTSAFWGHENTPRNTWVNRNQCTAHKGFIFVFKRVSIYLIARNIQGCAVTVLLCTFFPHGSTALVVRGL